MRIVVDSDKCTGLGICESLAPDFFEVAEDGTVLVHIEEPTVEQRDEVQKAIDGCPTLALRLEG